ncbi:MAG TPA: alpha/beta fold hydrolase [Hyphomicrobiaceae bacterium]
MWSKEYWAKKGEVDLFMWRKRLDDPAEGVRRPVFFLVHGSSFSGPSGFDMQIEGRDYSFMDKFAEYGFDVWALDHEGYGRSSRTGSNSNIAMGAEDLRAGMEVVRRETGQNRYAFYGQSSGALRAALFAEKHPEWVERLVLDAFVWTGEGAPTLIKRREKLDEFRASNTRPVDRPFFHSIFNRDRPGTSETLVADKLADLELALGDRVPTGTYLDMCAHLPVVDPEKIRCPVLIVRGEYDGIATEEDLVAFWMRLSNKDKQFVILPGQAHVAPLGINRHRFWHAVHAFLTMPPRRDPPAAS